MAGNRRGYGFGRGVLLIFGCPRPARRSFGRAEARFTGLVSLGWFGSLDCLFKKRIIAVREVVTALIAVKGGRQGADVNALPDPSFMPI